jgi:adenylate cyclase
MAKEIERKFLVFGGAALFEKLQGQAIVQGYLHDKGMTSRIRIVDNQEALLTLKGPRRGLSRDEFEYAIPLTDGLELLAYCGDHRLE